MIRTSRPLTEGICHVRATGPPAGYLTELISFRVLIYHCSAEWTAGLRELITATHHLCNTAAEQQHITEKLYDQYMQGERCKAIRPSTHV